MKRRMMMKMMMIENKAMEWLSYNLKDYNNYDCFQHISPLGLIVCFYDKETWEDLDLILTVPMVEELLKGKSPKKIKNKYIN